jgi:hypothetical protein
MSIYSKFTICHGSTRVGAKIGLVQPFSGLFPTGKFNCPPDVEKYGPNLERRREQVPILV